MVSPLYFLPGGVSPASASLVDAWQTDRPTDLTRHVIRLTAPNPGVMTGPGTNSYLVGEPSTGFTVIDPGPADHDHLQRLWLAAKAEDGSGGNILRIVCTHSHPDHAPGAAPLQALCEGAPPVLGLPSAPTARAASEFHPDRSLSNYELLTHIKPTPEGNGAPEATHTLRVIFTPGHAANHLCLLLEEEGLLFSGDHILNGSTTVIDPPDGNMNDYLNSLDTLSEECSRAGVQYILPAHGHVMDGALHAIRKLKAHRLHREAKVAAAMAALPDADPEKWLAIAYDDVDPRLWPVAKRSLLAHVERIKTLSEQAGCR
jgi:glyoxylase-like metal-dependent hydrolase (beta-lactamase superfamily II)